MFVLSPMDEQFHSPLADQRRTPLHPRPACLTMEGFTIARSTGERSIAATRAPHQADGGDRSAAPLWPGGSNTELNTPRLMATR